MIFIRTGAIIFSVPVFGASDVPKTAKIGLALSIAWIVFPSIRVPPELDSAHIYYFIPAIISEMIIGFAIGFACRLFFEGVQLGGQLIGFQMGFGIVNVIDPITGANFSIIAQVQNLFATLLFLALGMHYWFFKAIALSFEKIPLFHCYVSDDLWRWIIDVSSIMFVIGVKVAAPIMAVLLFTSLGLGMLTKAVPRMRVFIVMFPLKISLGLFAVGFSMPMFGYVMKKNFLNLRVYIETILTLASS